MGKESEIAPLGRAVAPVDGDLFAQADLEGTIARIFRRGAGHSDAAVRRRPVIGICTSYSELNPCNLGLRGLAEAVRRGVAAAGGQAIAFPTISLAEAYAKPSTMFLRNLMAMDVEEMIRSAPIDGVVLLHGCDKTVPAQLMGALSAGKPAIGLAAGPRATSRWRERTLTIDDLWPLADARRAGEIDDDAWRELEGRIVGGVGTCNVMGTATTMAIVAEVLGMALPGTALLPAASGARREAAEATGARAVALALARRAPRELVTPAAVRNALRVVCATGGSTNALIHLQALAGRIGAPLALETLRAIARETPLIADVRPSGPHLLEELEAAGGTPALVRELAPLLDVDQLAGDGRTWAEVAAATASDAPSPALRTLADPVDAGGGMTILQGSLAPDGAVLKRAAADPRLRRHRGRALVFDGLAELRRRIDDPALEADADSVLVLRGVGPLGAPGMPEAGAIPIPRALLARGVRDILRVSDARMSGTAAGTVVLHVAPESAVGGPLALVRDGDPIALDAERGTLELDVEPRELARRRAAWTPAPPPTRGYERLFHEHVLQADRGCDFDFLADAGLAHA